MKQNFVLGITAGILIILIFSACQKQSGSGLQSTEEKIVLRILSQYGEGDIPDGSDESHNIFVDYLREVTPCDFEFTFYQSDDDRNAMLASGAEYDIVNSSGFNTLMLLSLQQQNYLAPIDVFLKNASNITDEKQTPGILWPAVTIDGKIYSIPVPPAIELFGSLGMRVDWLKKLGLSVPKNIDEFKNVLIAFRDRDPDGNGVKDTIPFSFDLGYDGICPLFRSIFEIPADYFIDSAKKIQFAYTTGNARKMIAYMADLYKEGLIDPEFAIQNKELQGQWITNDRIGSAWVYWWYMKNWDLAIKESHNTNDSLFWWVEPPQTISGKQTKLQISGPADNLIMFPAKGHVKEAVDFINRLLEPDVAETLNFGFEGIHWKRDENGNRYLTDEYNEIIWRWKYCDGLIFRGDYMIESENLEYGKWRIPIQSYAGGTDTWNILLPPIPGIEDTITGISDYTQVELVKFIMGERPINQYDSFIQELKQKGLDNVLSAQQKVYDSQK